MRVCNCKFSAGTMITRHYYDNKYAVNTEHDVNFYVYEYDYLFESVKYAYTAL